MTVKTPAQGARKPFMAELQKAHRTAPPGSAPSESSALVGLMPAEPVPQLPPVSVEVDHTPVLRSIAELHAKVDRIEDRLERLVGLGPGIEGKTGFREAAE